jgi:hypothetical protein
MIMTAVLIASASGYIYNTGTSGKNQTNTSSLQSNISSLQQQLQTLQAKEGCLVTTAVPQRPTGNLTPVLLMKPGTTGTVCVMYKTSWGGNASLYTNYTASLASRYWFGISVGRNNSVSHSFTVSMRPNPVTPSASLSSITVLYQVTALANSTGFYDHSAPYGYCDTMPMAVGYSASQVNGSDFPARPPAHACPAEAYIPTVVGIAGMTFTLVDIPASRSYMTAPSVGSFCSETTQNYTGNVPCFADTRSQAYVFNCTSTAATPSGCTATMGTGSSAFNVTVWYPAKNQTFPWAGCYYIVSNASGKTSADWEVCIALTSNSFVVATPPGPLT